MVCNIFGGADIADYSDIDVSDGMIIAADRGFIHCLRLGIADRTDILIGDLDSLGSVPENVPVIKAPREKDDTDMMLAVKWAFDKGCTEFRIYGGIGGRLGHTAANIQTLLYIQKMGGYAVMYGDDCDIELMHTGSRSFPYSEKIKHISLFSVSDRTEAELTGGFKYKGELTFTKDFPLGVSNEVEFGKTGIISVKSGNLLVIREKK